MKSNFFPVLLSFAAIVDFWSIWLMFMIFPALHLRFNCQTASNKPFLSDKPGVKPWNKLFCSISCYPNLLLLFYWEQNSSHPIQITWPAILFLCMLYKKKGATSFWNLRLSICLTQSWNISPFMPSCGFSLKTTLPTKNGFCFVMCCCLSFFCCCHRPIIFICGRHCSFSAVGY